MNPYASLSSDKLIGICAASTDEDAWEEFVFRFQKPISLSVIRVVAQCGEVAKQTVEDLVQETFLKICKNKLRPLESFAVDRPDAVLAYIRVVAINVARDYFKSARSRRRGGSQHELTLSDLPAAVSETRSGPQENMEKSQMLRQIDAILVSIGSGAQHQRNRAAFWLHYRAGMTCKEIADIPAIGLSSKGVESLILRLTRHVKTELLRSASLPAKAAVGGLKSTTSLL